MAMAVPVGLLVAQIASVNFFVRQLQSAVSFISSAHAVIEADFDALERDGRVLFRYVDAAGSPAAIWLPHASVRCRSSTWG